MTERSSGRTGLIAASCFAVLALFATPEARAQAAGGASTVQEARKAWAAAVMKADGPGAAAQTAFPFQYEGYQAPRTITRAQYLREIPHWATLKQCLATEPMEQLKKRSRLGTHTFNCDGHGFFFAKRDGVWRLTGYENSNE